MIRDLLTDVTYDVVLVTVRRDQFYEIVPVIAALPADRVVFMLNIQSEELTSVARRVGTDRTVFVLPSVGGQRTENGATHYLEMPRQKTTVGRRGGLKEPVVKLLRSASFRVDITDGMEG